MRRCKYDGTVVNCYRCDCFVRGIGSDSDGNIYILCSRADPYLLKLNKNFRKIKRTENQYSRHFSEAKGMIVTSGFVLITSEKYNQICVFNLQLDFQYNLKLTSIQGPIAISTFQNRYIVTGKGAIAIFDINFENKEVQGETLFENMHQDNKSVKFDPHIRFRGICAIENYIYVTQLDISGEENIPGLPIMCLEFEGETLNYVGKGNNIKTHCTVKCTEKCGSIVIFCHNETIFYSQGSHGEFYHIVKATHNPREPIETTKVFDVL